MTHSPLTQLRESCKARIKEFGFTFISVQDDADGPGLVYTVGLTNYGLPELAILANVPPHTAQTLMHDVAMRAMESKKMVLNERIADVLVDYDVRLQRVKDRRKAFDKYTVQVPFILEEHEDDIEVVQVILPDTENRFPDESGYNLNPKAQVVI